MATLVVQKDRLLYNLSVLRSLSEAEVIPVLKGNAYGLGDTELARLFAEAGVKTLAVSTIDEAERVREAAPEPEVLLLSPYRSEDEARRVIACGVTAAVGSYEGAELLDRLAGEADVECRAHLAFDTGMGRFGFLPQEAQRAAAAAKDFKNLEITGCFTHFSNSFGKKGESARRQFTLFEKCVQVLEENGVGPLKKHVSNSAAAILYPQFSLDAVRVGSALLGRVSVLNKLGLKKVGRLECPVCDVRTLPVGHNIGYADTFRTKRPTQIAVIPAGYADGLFVAKAADTFRFRDILRYVWRDFRALFGKSIPTAKIGGQKAPLVGRVGMCCVIADVTGLDVKPGDIASFDVNPITVSQRVPRRYE